MTYAARADELATGALAEPSLNDLQHIPGEDGWPVLGNTLRLLANPKGEIDRMAATYGLVYRNRAFGIRSVNMLGPEANEFVMFDRHKLFSSGQGWGPFLNR